MKVELTIDRTKKLPKPHMRAFLQQAVWTIIHDLRS